MYFASIKSPENDWLTQTNSFLMGDFMFIPDGKRTTKKQLDVSVKYKQAVDTSSR